MNHPTPIMDIARSLQTLKVADLKVKCRELKITNYSKLNKSQLIEVILVHAHPNAPNAPEPAASSTIASDPTTCPAVEPKHKRQRTESSSSFPLPDGPKESFKAPQNQASATSAAHAIHPRARLPYITSTPSLTQQPTDDLNVAAANASPTSFPTLSTTGLSEQLPEPIASTVSAPPRKISSKTKPKTILPSVIRERTFQALVPIPRPPPRTALDHASESFSSERQASPGMSSHGRVHYVSNHFLNQAAACLHKYRVHPINSPPFPYPTTYPIETRTLTHDLPFQAIHPSLYTSVYPFGALKVAIRFWVFRLHTHMQQGCGEAWSGMGGGLGLLGPDLSTWPAVVSCRMVSKDVWVVDTECSRTDEESVNGEVAIHKERFLILEATGEAIASASSARPVQQHESDNVIEGCRVRPDWFARIQQGDASDPLLQMIGTKEEDAYPAGISKSWQSRVGNDQELMKTAERAVLASCALNSTSGCKMTAVEMDAESIGKSTVIPRSKAEERVALYLPE
ncbi:hypothetical protein, variant [Cryptococcus amylolentus CBS 6039]|nr:hypothetical protein, variant [Cryptococcus amylolentus CBS 6039]ODN72963.1 hypothetical protein, variant [Cryptococcus amylolentus CBS 6039]ODN98127.1 hypothetical protein I350_07769 [Cryptococcus amylolentus CBS 6273]